MFHKRGIGLIILGFLLVIITIYPAYIRGIAPSVFANIAGWVMFIAGALIRGKQKKNQRQLEDAMYQWAAERSVAPTPRHVNARELNYANTQRQNAYMQGNQAHGMACGAPWICPRCGAQMRENFCANCGTQRP